VKVAEPGRSGAAHGHGGNGRGRRRLPWAWYGLAEAPWPQSSNKALPRRGEAVVEEEDERHRAGRGRSKGAACSGGREIDNCGEEEGRKEEEGKEEEVVRMQMSRH